MRPLLSLIHIYTKLVELVTAAMIGEEPEELNARFQGGKKGQ